MFQFRKVEVSSRALTEPMLCVVKEVEGKIEKAAGGHLAIHFNMLFGQMPAARSDQKRRGSFSEPVLLSVSTAERNGSPDSVTDVDLSIQSAFPGGRVRIFEIGHTTVCTRVR